MWHYLADQPCVHQINFGTFNGQVYFIAAYECNTNNIFDTYPQLNVHTMYMIKLVFVQIIFGNVKPD